MADELVIPHEHLTDDLFFPDSNYLKNRYTRANDIGEVLTDAHGKYVNFTIGNTNWQTLIRPTTLVDDTTRYARVSFWCLHGLYNYRFPSYSAQEYYGDEFDIPFPTNQTFEYAGKTYKIVRCDIVRTTNSVYCDHNGVNSMHFTSLNTIAVMNTNQKMRGRLNFGRYLSNVPYIEVVFIGDMFFQIQEV